MSTMSEELVKTGDVLLFTNNTQTGLTIRVFTGSSWSHVSIAIRLLDKPDYEDFSKLKISKDERGKLYLLEVGPNHNKLLLPYEELKIKNNLIAYRSMKEEYRTEKFIKRAKKFILKNRYISFTTDIIPYISLMTGFKTESGVRYKDGKPNMFCSELANYFFSYTLDIEMNVCPGLTTPCHFDSMSPAFKHIFSDKMYYIHRNYTTITKTIVYPLLIGLLLSMLIWYLLPNNNWRNAYLWSKQEFQWVVGRQGYRSH